MQGLCCLDVQGPEAAEQVAAFIRDSRDPPEAVALAQQMLNRAWAHREQSDTALGQQSEHWDVRRMPVVDRNILRLAAWELATGAAPPTVVINEAIRLGKEFSTAESPRFINGVLDGIVKQMDKT